MSRHFTNTHRHASRRQFLAWLVAATVPSLPACRDMDYSLWKPPTPADEAFEVDHVRNVVYHHGPDANDHHQLDVYLPRGQANFPVVLLVHGGAWMLGDKHSWGLYASVGEFFARHGVAAVLPNYRLSPAVQHPAHIKDVARALAWTREQIAGLGGNPDQLFLVGHSAGGHLVSLLATHPGYLRDAHVDPAAIRGVISVCGVYRIPDGLVDVRLGGPTSDAFRADQIFPVRAASSRPGWLRSPIPGLPLSVDVYSTAFGDDPAIRRDASPIEHVRPGLPPFLLMNAQDDLPTLPAMAREFHAALVARGNQSELRLIADRNHTSVFLNALDAKDPVGRAMLDFIHGHLPPARCTSPARPD